MRHYKKGRKLGTDASHTKAIKKSLVVALFTNDRIKTTLERAKEIRGDVDQVITWAKRGDVHSRRLAIAKLGDKTLVGEIFSKVEQGLFKDRPGGYTRILRLGLRRGDSATIVIMELVQEPYIKKASKDVEAKPARRLGRRADTKAADKAKGKKAKDEAVEADEVDEAVDEDVVEDVVEDVIDIELVEDAAEAVEDAAEEVAEAVEAAEAAEEVVEATEEAPAETATEEAPAEETAAEVTEEAAEEVVEAAEEAAPAEEASAEKDKTEE